MSGKQNKASDPARRKTRLKPVERMPIVRRGIEEGKSRRELARELDCDEATIRRDLKKLDLPPEEQAAIREGDSVEKYLNAALLRKTGVDRSARNKIGRRRREERQTGKHSEPLADALLDWLSTKSLTDCNTKLVLEHALHASESLPDGQVMAERRRFGQVVEPLERDPNPDRRLTSPEPDFLNQCSRVLVRGLVGAEPVQVIRQSALKKAKAKVDARGHWIDLLVSRFEKAQIEKVRIAKRREARDRNEA